MTSSRRVGSACPKGSAAWLLLACCLPAQEPADDALARAQRECAAGEIATAVTLLRDPQLAPKARRALIQASYGNQQMAPADRVQLLRLAAAPLEPGRLRALVRLHVAEDLVSLEQADEAIPLLLELDGSEHLVPQRLRIHEKLAAAYRSRGQLEAALDVVDRYDRLPGASAQVAAVLRADCLVKAGNPALALRALRQQQLFTVEQQQAAAELRGNAIQARIDAELASERFRPVLAYLEELERAGVQGPVLAFARAVAQERLGHEGAVAALEAITQGTSMDGDAPRYRARARVVLAQRELRAGNVEAARRWLDGIGGPAGVDQLVTEVHVALREGASAEALEAPRGQLQQEWRRLVQSCSELRPLPGGAASLQLLERRNVLATIWSCWLVGAVSEADRRAVAEKAAAMLLELDAAGSLARRVGAPAADPEHVRARLLPADGAVVFVLPASFQSFVLLLTESGWDLHTAPGDRGLRKLVQAFGAELSGVHNDPQRSVQRLQQRGQALRDRVLPAAVRGVLADASRVVVVGRDLVGGLSFECLPWEGRYPYLGLAKAVSYLPSVALAVAHDRQPFDSVGPTLRLVAPTVESAHAASWKVSAETLRGGEVSALLRFPQQTEVVTGDVSLQTACAPGQPAVLTALFGHGIYDPKRACPAGLLLNPSEGHDGATFFDDVADGDGPIGDVVLLCSCGSARGTLQRGDDASWHLGGALMVRGTRLVALADLDLEVGATTRFVDHVVRAIGDAGSMDLAFLQARRAVARELGDRPSNWGLLRLEGPAARPLPEARLAPLRSGSWWLWGGVVVAALAVVMAALRRRR